MKRSILAFAIAIGFGSAAGLQAADKAAGIGPAFRGPVGLQLYSLRAQLTQNPAAGIKLASSFGIREVELAGTYGLEASKFRRMLLDAGLEPVSGHFPFDAYRTNLAQVATDAKALGLRYAGCAWIPHQAEFSEKDARQAVEVFNRAGAELGRQGIQFFYHSHGYEFYRYGDGYLMDLLIRETDPKHVAFQMDTTWIFFPGQDPAAWLRKYPGRWQLMHLKDLKKGVARGALTGNTDPNNDVALGTGQLDWAGILKAAQEVGVKHYFIEDEAAASPEQIPQSLRYLEQLRW